MPAVTDRVTRMRCATPVALLMILPSQLLNAGEPCSATVKREAAPSAPAWMAGFVERDSDGVETVACGGVVVDVVSTGQALEVGILTAKHCLDSRPESVILGRTRLDATARILLDHRAYNEMLIGDLALVPVTVPAGYSPKPTALPVATPDATANPSLNLYSWGDVGSLRSRLWLGQGLRLVSTRECSDFRARFPYETIVKEIGFCAGRSGYELVPFDSGGALVADGSLVGIASARHCWVGRFSDPHWRVPEEKTVHKFPYADLTRCTRATSSFTSATVDCPLPTSGRKVVTGRTGTTAEVPFLADVMMDIKKDLSKANPR